MAVSHFDRPFRLIFSTSEAKADLARNVLPGRYLEKIRLESLQSEDASFIDEELKEHFTDILMFFELKEEKNSKHKVPADSDLAKAIYRVLAAVKERREIEEFLEHARKMRYTDIEEGVMKFAQEVREDGEKIGLEKGETLGKIKDKQEILKRQLRNKFGLSEEEAAQIDRIEDLEALDAALDEILDVEDKKKVLEKLGL